MAACCGVVGSAQAQHVTEYTYDEAGQLIQVNGPGSYERRYEYDDAGNRVLATYEPPNQPPVAVNDTVDTNDQAGTVVFDPRTNDSDPEGAPLLVLNVFNVQHSQPGAAAFITERPDNRVDILPLQAGTTTFSYTLSDGVDTDTAQVTVVVEGSQATCGDIFCLDVFGFLGGLFGTGDGELTEDQVDSEETGQ